MHTEHSLTMKFERAMRVYKASAYTQDLRPVQWEALRYFATVPPEERTVTAFARARASTMGTTSVTITRLVKRGLLDRTGDRRNVGLQITESGQTLLNEADPANCVSEALSELSWVEQEVFGRALEHLLERLEQEDCGIE